MPIRRILFWSHLAAGLIAGIFIFLMSVTGVLLMYEHPIFLAVGDSVKIEAEEGAEALTADELLTVPAVTEAGTRGVSLNFENRDGAPVMVRVGRSGAFSIDPYTGEEVENPAWAVNDFFHVIVDIHRWLGAEGENRAMGRAVTGAANLVFLFLVVSGIYLWLPKAWKWTFFKLNMLFRKSYPTSKARDFNWHHVLGFWALIPLFFIVISGVMISYPWAANLIYTAWGEEVPQRGAQTGNTSADQAPVDLNELTSLQSALEEVMAYSDKNWTRITLSVPSEPSAQTLSFQRNFGDRIIPQQRVSLTYDRVVGEISDVRTYADNSPAMKTRMFLRFAHTGERFGIIGSTIAGLSSLAACFLVYTGFALSFRRLILPLLRKRKAQKQA